MKMFNKKNMFGLIVVFAILMIAMQVSARRYDCSTKKILRASESACESCKIKRYYDAGFCALETDEIKACNDRDLDGDGQSDCHYNLNTLKCDCEGIPGCDGVIGSGKEEKTDPAGHTCCETKLDENGCCSGYPLGCDGICGSGKVMGCDGVCGSGKYPTPDRSGYYCCETDIVDGCCPGNEDNCKSYSPEECERISDNCDQTCCKSEMIDGVCWGYCWLDERYYMDEDGNRCAWRIWYEYRYCPTDLCDGAGKVQDKSGHWCCESEKDSNGCCPGYVLDCEGKCVEQSVADDKRNNGYCCSDGVERVSDNGGNKCCENVMVDGCCPGYERGCDDVCGSGKRVGCDGVCGSGAAYATDNGGHTCCVSIDQLKDIGVAGYGCCPGYERFYNEQYMYYRCELGAGDDGCPRYNPRGCDGVCGSGKRVGCDGECGSGATNVKDKNGNICCSAYMEYYGDDDMCCYDHPMGCDRICGSGKVNKTDKDGHECCETEIDENGCCSGYPLGCDGTCSGKVNRIDNDGHVCCETEIDENGCCSGYPLGCDGTCSGKVNRIDNGGHECCDTSNTDDCCAGYQKGCDGICGSGKVAGCDGVCGSGKVNKTDGAHVCCETNLVSSTAQKVGGDSITKKCCQGYALGCDGVCGSGARIRYYYNNGVKIYYCE